MLVSEVAASIRDAADSNVPIVQSARLVPPAVWQPYDVGLMLVADPGGRRQLIG